MAVEFSCADVGVTCKATTRAASADELVAKVAAHAREAHGVMLNETLVAYALTKVQDTSPGTQPVRPPEPTG